MDAIIRPHGSRENQHRKRRSGRDAYTYEQLQEMQQLPLDKKIEWTDSVIQKALEVLKMPALAFSAGKDSTVMLHRVLKFALGIHPSVQYPICAIVRHGIYERGRKMDIS